MCETATGATLVVKQTGAFAASVYTADEDDQFVLVDGTVLDKLHDLDLGGAAYNQAGLACIAAHKWAVMGQIGTCADGGAH